MSKLIPILIFTLLIWLVPKVSHTQIIPITIVPVYSYKPLKINVGKFDQKLTNLDSNNIDSSIIYFNNNVNKMKIEELYILSIRLYDLGEKDKSIYWFHQAKTRARIFINMLNPDKIGGIGSPAFEKKQMFIAFNQLAGEYINGYGGGEIDVWVEAIDSLLVDIDTYTNYKSIYPNIKFKKKSFLSDIIEAKMKELNQTKKYLLDNKSEIYKMRKENGIDGKY